MTNLFQALVGTWFICSTSFPMWLKGDKTSPTFTYSVTQQKGQANVLLDEVKYVQKGQPKTLTGFDYPDPKDDSAFVWRGKGLLSLVRSHWKVALQDPNGQWAVIWFSGTLFTREGVDIISRQPQLPDELLNHIKSLMADDPQLARHLIDVRDLPIR
ncbi:lipocalin/fatty-acid binding family protein [Spirosoma koreense]